MSEKMLEKPKQKPGQTNGQKQTGGVVGHIFVELTVLCCDYSSMALSNRRRRAVSDEPNCAAEVVQSWKELATE